MVPSAKTKTQNSMEYIDCDAEVSGAQESCLVRSSKLNSPWLSALEKKEGHGIIWTARLGKGEVVIDRVWPWRQTTSQGKRMFLKVQRGNLILTAYTREDNRALPFSCQNIIFFASYNHSEQRLETYINVHNSEGATSFKWVEEWCSKSLSV